MSKDLNIHGHLGELRYYITETAKMSLDEGQTTIGDSFDAKETLAHLQAVEQWVESQIREIGRLQSNLSYQEDLSEEDTTIIAQLQEVLGEAADRIESQIQHNLEPAECDHCRFGWNFGESIIAEIKEALSRKVEDNG